MDLQAARKLYFDFDGFHFHMTRDGREADYRKAGVSPEVEAAWLEELKREKLGLLSKKGNWSVVYFFLMHADLGHLADFVQAEPRGVLWERCSFLETLLTYAGEVKKAGRDPALVSQAARKASIEAERLLRRARADRSVERVRAILAQARQLLREIEKD
jgi:hypothetical protein